MGNAICGGVMSISQSIKGMKKYGVYYGLMSFVMPDKHFKKYIACLKAKDKKKAEEIFKKYAISQI